MTSSTKAMINQQEPSKKHPIGTTPKFTQNKAIISNIKAMRKPKGAFQLNGSLKLYNKNMNCVSGKIHFL